jgi:hypothetical protein
MPLTSRSVGLCFVVSLLGPSYAFLSLKACTSSRRLHGDAPPSSVKRKPTAAAAEGAGSHHIGGGDAVPEGFPDGTPPSHTVRVWYEDRSCDVLVRPDETILTALERDLVSDRLGLPSHAVPSDCRRGSCLTCTGTHASAASREAAGRGGILVQDDGLSPHMSQELRDRGYVLTCSTRVAGEGLQLVLGQNNDVWKELYQQRLEDDTARKIGWAAMALTKRKSDERNVPRWARQTEAVLEETPAGSSENETAL